MAQLRTAGLTLAAMCCLLFPALSRASEGQSIGAPRTESDRRARVAAGAASGETSGWANLSEDNASGAGFYPLPRRYRTGALDQRRRRAVEYANNPIRAAIASEAIGYDYDQGYAFGHGHGVFDPDDGYGTPFFAGYYN